MSLPDHDHDHSAHGHGHARRHAQRGQAHAHADHGHDHGGHGHVHTSNETRLRWALAITAVFMLVEVAGGLIAHSLALIADAVHMLTDAASLVLALVALRIGRRPADRIFSYGHHRYEVLAAFVNGLALLLLSAWIIIECAQRLLQPQAVAGTLMLGVAAGGFAANLASFLVLRDGEDTLNMRAALIHILGDLLGSAAAVVAALVILSTGWTPVDPILSALVAALILRSGWRITRQSMHILLEAVPAGIDTAGVAEDLVAHVPGLRGIHHLHAWSLTDARPMMTLHAQLDERVEHDAALAAIRSRLRTHFGVEHATVQIERAGCADPDAETGCHDSAQASRQRAA